MDSSACASASAEPDASAIILPKVTSPPSTVRYLDSPRSIGSSSGSSLRILQAKLEKAEADAKLADAKLSFEQALDRESERSRSQRNVKIPKADDATRQFDVTLAETLHHSEGPLLPFAEWESSAPIIEQQIVAPAAPN